MRGSGQRHANCYKISKPRSKSLLFESPDGSLRYFWVWVMLRPNFHFRSMFISFVHDYCPCYPRLVPIGSRSSEIYCLNNFNIRCWCVELFVRTWLFILILNLLSSHISNKTMAFIADFYLANLSKWLYDSKIGNLKRKRNYVQSQNSYWGMFSSFFFFLFIATGNIIIMNAPRAIWTPMK